MTHRTRGAALIAAAAFTLAAAPAQAQSVDTYYFKCATASKVQNGLAVLQPAFWSTAKPAASFTAGAGCGFADFPAAGGLRPSTTPENFYDAWYKGTHEKAVASARVELHNLLTSRVREGETVTLSVRLSTGSGGSATTLKEQTFTVKPTLSSSGASEKVAVEFTGLRIPAATGRVVNITVHSGADTPQAWVHDATEVPASVTFTEPAPA